MPSVTNGRFSHLPRFLGRVSILATLLLAPVLLITFFVRRHNQANRIIEQPSAVTFSADDALTFDPSQPTAATRPIFPLSIVPGGVRNAKELQAVSATDPVVAQHYADFQITRAHTVHLDHPVAMYVSYRRNDHVYWTRNRMIIPAGETLITDGESFARTRCANRLSPIAVKPVAAVDPTTEQLSEPSFVPPLMAGLLPGENTGLFPDGPGTFVPGAPVGEPQPAPGSPTPPVLPPILLPGGPPIGPTTPPPPVNTPEPGTLTLLCASLAGAYFAARRSRRKIGM